MTGHAERTYQLCLRFFTELAALGVRHVMVSPGSRSTPLALSADAADLDVTVHIDERVAAFCALGVGKATGVPAVLVCTSGTALANQLPAVVEAHHAGVPLIVCSGDRPPELRRQGAGQTIDQVGIFAGATRWTHEMPVASEVDEAVGRSAALRAFTHATAEAGPVHLNWPFRKPLDPPGPLTPPAPGLSAGPGRRSAPSTVLAELGATHERGLVVVGPTDHDPATLAEIAAFGARWGWPVVADAASGLRGIDVADAPLVATADLWMHDDQAVGDPPDVVLRVGLGVTSAALARRMESWTTARTVLVGPGVEWPDPGAMADTIVAGPVPGLFDAGPDSGGPGRGDTDWTSHWRLREARAAAVAAEAVASAGAETAATAVVCGDRTHGHLVVSSSMPVRVVEAVHGHAPGAMRVWSNRGANGIDGVIATATGVAIAAGAPTIALVGDVALVHDLGGLAALARCGAAVTVVVVDNAGGGIFSMLPVREAVAPEVFDRLFTTPPGVDAVAVATGLGIEARSVACHDIADAVARMSDSGPRLIHVTAPSEPTTADGLRALRAQVAAAMAAPAPTP
ncbi:MAG: 2-succinyl-5-enolpyruvyl-6-hydroxy-3-cyclohexene-1-carboxylic-acid synthase [Acidimicrobiales bacterium]